VLHVVLNHTIYFIQETRQ